MSQSMNAWAPSKWASQMLTRAVPERHFFRVDITSPKVIAPLIQCLHYTPWSGTMHIASFKMASLLYTSALVGRLLSWEQHGQSREKLKALEPSVIAFSCRAKVTHQVTDGQAGSFAECA